MRAGVVLGVACEDGNTSKSPHPRKAHNLACKLLMPVICGNMGIDQTGGSTCVLLDMGFCASRVG